MADEKKTIFNEVKRICPLRAIPKDEDYMYCAERLCAWWNYKETCCSVKLIAEDLNHIASHSKFQ